MMVQGHLNVSVCQLPKHAASLQSKITGTSDTASQNEKSSYYSACSLALGDIIGIFKPTLKHLPFSSYSCTIKSIFKENC